MKFLSAWWQSHLTRVRGLKCGISSNHTKLLYVAPYTVCGLKWYTVEPQKGMCETTPTFHVWLRGPVIEFDNQWDIWNYMRTNEATNRAMMPRRTPHGYVDWNKWWIQRPRTPITSFRTIKVRGLKFLVAISNCVTWQVAPNTGAWIEMSTRVPKHRRSYGRTRHGCVDWNQKTFA